MPEFLTDDGCRIVYDLFDDDADERLAPVVLHHGFGADANINWVRPGVLDALIDTGRFVVTFDARGHGRSEKLPDPARYGTARLARDVELLADHLGLHAYDLVGYSMGAGVAATVAAGDRRVRRLVLGGVGGALVDARLRAEQHERMRGLFDQLQAGDDSAVAEAVGGLFRSAASANPADHAALLAVLQAPMPDGGPDVGAITAPTLLLVGADDPLAGEPEVLAAAIPGARLEIVAGDHLRALAAPAFRAELVRFLSDPL
jgi:pimeloyl-ACP methyl ester carboxylesterase